MDIEKKALIEKLAQADGPSRELDAEIALALNLYPFTNDLGHYHDPAMACGEGETWAPPRYTASIDAALTLVPDGATGLISIGLGYARIERSDGTHWSGDAATPALALCIAALSAKEPSQ